MRALLGDDGSSLREPGKGQKWNLIDELKMLRGKQNQTLPATWQNERIALRGLRYVLSRC